MQMHVAKLRQRAGGRWRGKVTAQGRATVNAGTLGDAKRAAEALAQRPLIWRRIREGVWVGDPPTAEQQARIDRAYDADVPRQPDTALKGYLKGA